MSKSSKRAVIIGCGIAGPATALFLSRVGIEAEIYEGSDLVDTESGLFLNVARNGMRVLQQLGIDEPIREMGIAMYSMQMMNGRGKILGYVGQHSGEPQGYTVKRQQLHTVLRDAAISNGIKINYGKRLKSLEVDSSTHKVQVYFEDGSATSGDFVVGCDGINSKTRTCILPDAPSPNYTGLISFGGYLHGDNIPFDRGTQHLVFGKKAFFGYLGNVRTNEVYWFGNIDYPGSPTRRELMSIPQETWRRKMEHLYESDVHPVPEIVQRTEGELLFYPIYDMSPLSKWHNGPVVLVGDAVHATSPNAGQGASLALEDAMVLSKCVRDIPDLEDAFRKYTELRKDRVERVVRYSRQIGNRKHATNPIQVFFRDLMLPIFLKQANKQSNDWLYDFNINWDCKLQR